MDEEDPPRRDPSEVWLIVALVGVTAAMILACALIAWMEISGRA
jgi:hypothetical protein